MDFGAKWHQFFHSNGLNKPSYARRQVIPCVTKVSACHHTLHANHWHCLWKNASIIAVKSNVTTFIQVLRFVVNIFYCERVAFTVPKHADIKGVRQRPLTTGIVRRQFPSLRGTTWRNNAMSAWNGSRFEHIRAFYVEITNIHGWNWKCDVIIVIKTDMSGLVVPMHSGLCERPRDLISHAPSCIGTTNPSRTGPNPLSIELILTSLQCVTAGNCRDACEFSKRYSCFHIQWRGLIFREI